MDTCENLTATKGEYKERIKLTWNAKADAEGYSILVKDLATGRDSVIVPHFTSPSIPVEKFVDTSLYNFVYGTRYTLGVSAYSYKFADKRVHSDTVWTVGYLSPADIDSVWISQGLIDSIKVRVRYLGGHDLTIWRKISGGTFYSNNFTKLDAHSRGSY